MRNIARSFENKDNLEFFHNWKQYNSLQKYTIAAILCDLECDESLSQLIEMSTEGEEHAIFSLYLLINYRSNEYKVNWSLLNANLVKSLIDQLSAPKTGRWALGCLSVIAKERRDLFDYIKHSTANVEGMQKIALMYCDVNDQENLWREIEKISSLSLHETISEPVFLFEELEVNWIGKERIFINLLQIGNLDLSKALLESLYDYRKGSFDFDSVPISWWLDWMNNVPSDDSEYEEGAWILYRLGKSLGSNASAKMHEFIVNEFNNPDSKYRNLILGHIFSTVPNLTLEQFTDEAISFLMSDLDSEWFYNRFSLGSVATEKFVEEELIPLLGKEDEPFRTNLRRAIKLAEDKHKRRFIIGG